MVIFIEAVLSKHHGDILNYSDEKERYIIYLKYMENGANFREIGTMDYENPKDPASCGSHSSSISSLFPESSFFNGD